MKILALNPFHGGSHQAFLETWMRHSRHEFETLTQPATRWKWRMRQSAVTFAAECNDRYADQPVPDAIFTTDMLSLAEFRGLCPRLSGVPVVVYFHENQLTYPVNPVNESRPDLQPAFSNFCTALAASEVWFNSQFHLNDYCTAAAKWLARMPDGKLDRFIEQIRSKSRVQYPGVMRLARQGLPTTTADTGPPHLVWVSRWEHDKQPNVFFDALDLLKQSGFKFRLSVLGESHAHQPPCFDSARQNFKPEIVTWGYQPSRNDYEQALRNSDIVVSTAAHEFFGIAVVEAVSAGCCPVVPGALAYPEVLGTTLPVFHDGSLAAIAAAIRECAASIDERRELTFDVASRYESQQRGTAMDERIESVVLQDR